MGKQYRIWQKKLLVQSWPVRSIKINSNQWSECHMAKVFLLQCQGAQRQIPCAVKTLHLGRGWEMSAHPCWHASLRSTPGWVRRQRTRDDPSALRDAVKDFVHCPGPGSCLTVDPGVTKGFPCFRRWCWEAETGRLGGEERCAALLPALPLQRRGD